MSFAILPFTLEDYPNAYALWQVTPGIGLSAADEQAEIGRFLERNPGLSFVARQGDALVGAVLGGTDGRRGHLYHLAVHPGCRRQGIGQALARASLEALGRQGIQRCHILVYPSNLEGKAFWERVGFFERDDLLIMSINIQ